MSDALSSRPRPGGRAGTPDGRRERRWRALHARIVESAQALFDARGVEDVRVAEICERADVAHKTFFNHFPSKQHLLREIAHAGIDRLLEDLETVRKHPASTRERLRLFFSQLADNTEAAGPMRRELLTEMIHAGHSEGPDTEAEQTRRLHEAFRALIREGRSTGDLTRAHSVDTLAEMVTGSFYVLMFNWAHLEDYPLRRQALAAARLLGDALAPNAEETDG